MTKLEKYRTISEVMKTFGVPRKIAHRTVAMRLGLCKHGVITADDVHYFGKRPYDTIPRGFVKF